MTALAANWPFVVLTVSIGFIVLSIAQWKIHPFLALVLAALLAGVLARVFPEITAIGGVAVIGSLADVVKLTMEGFGRTAAGVAISIGLASIIGYCLMESGGADRVVRKFLGIFGERNAGIALLVSTYILSIPIFFDTMFMLMVPLAKALYVRTGKNYLLYILCVCCGGVITHCLTVPHPGPIAMVDNLKLDAGFAILASILAGLIPAAVGYAVAVLLNRWMPVPMRETLGASMEDMRSMTETDTRGLPGLGESLAPIVVPIVLIGLSSFLKLADGAGVPWLTSLGIWREVADFLGDKNIALFLGAALSIRVLVKANHLSRETLAAVLGPPLEIAGVIILITSAGGAFGAMIKNAGVGSAVAQLADQLGLSLLVLSYLLALIIRVAQGSSTVTMITTSAIIYPLMGPHLPYHPIYIFLSIGFASFSLAWMNDSGFWVVSRLSGMTEQETLKTFSVMLTVISLVGFLVVWLGSVVLPMV